MIVIRPTASLAKRMKLKLTSTDQKSESQLGDWYAVDFILSRRQFILCVSSLPRLAVVMEAAPYATFPERLCDAVTEVLKSIGVSEGNVQAERIKMDRFTIAKTENKSILGTLNDYRFQLEASDQMGRLDLSDTLKMSLYLSKTISLVLPEGYPRDAALKIFGQEIPSRPRQIEVVKPVASVKPKLYIVK